jgi:hypothetical protein
MNVLIYLAAMFFVCYAIGYALLCRQNVGLAHRYRAQIGYCYTLVAFYLSYAIARDIWLAVIFTVGFPLVYLLVRFLLSGKTAKAEIMIQIPPKELIIALFAVVILAAWPHMASGWGNYWHSGNYDIEDGLNGRDAYMNHQIYDDRPFFMEQITGDTTWEDFAKKAGVTSIRAHEKDSYYSWYAGDGFRFQYSNLAFWSCLLAQRHGMDMTLVHAVFCLMLMALSVYSLARTVFAMNPSWAATASFAATAGSFYLGTFWAGHIGSLMYGAVAPMLAAFALASGSRNDWIAAGPWLALAIGAMAFTYPHALVLGLGYWLGYRFFAGAFAARWYRAVAEFLRQRRLRQLLFALGILLAAGVLGYLAWQLTGSYRVRQDGQYRAWGLVHDLGITSAFFGYRGGEAFRNYGVYLVTTTLGAFSSLILMICVFSYRGVQSRFMRFFSIVWSAGLLFFYVFIRDSYYIYKYLYAHQFVFAIFICAFLACHRSALARGLGGVLLATNVAGDVDAAIAVYAMPYNGRLSEYESLAGLNKEILNASFVDINGGEGIAVRQTLKMHKIETEIDPRLANFFVRRSTGSDVTDEQLGDMIFSSDLFAVSKSPENNFLMVRTWFEPEIYPADPLLGATPFRWVGQGKNDNVGIYVIRPDHRSDTAMPFLRLCGQKGPSAVGVTTLHISGGDGKKIGSLPLDGVNCAWLPSPVVKDAVQPLLLRTGSVGKKLDPPEDRILLYRLFAVAWTNQKYDEQALSLLNPKTDELTSGLASVVQFGNGWWPPENYNGEHFRWASDGAEIIVSGQCRDRKVSLELETGPAHGSSPAIFSVSDGSGKVIGMTKMSAPRQRVGFSVPGPGVYKLATGSERHQIPGDNRILDFRVLGIEVGP